MSGAAVTVRSREWPVGLAERALILEEFLGSRRIEVRSPHVSREAIRWDIFLARFMDGDRPSLWGPTRFFEPCEEPELREELARLAGSPHGEWALALMRYVPPSRRAEPSFYRARPTRCAG